MGSTLHSQNMFGQLWAHRNTALRETDEVNSNKGSFLLSMEIATKHAQHLLSTIFKRLSTTSSLSH